MIRWCWSARVPNRCPCRIRECCRWRTLRRSEGMLRTMFESREKRWRVMAAGVLLGLGFVVILARLFQLQVIQAADLGQKAGRQHHKMLTIEGGRGTIYDRSGKILSM